MTTVHLGKNDIDRKFDTKYLDEKEDIILLVSDNRLNLYSRIRTFSRHVQRVYP